MIKLYEDFVTFNNLYDVIKQLENRIKYWFSQEGTLSKDTILIDVDASVTNKYSSKSIIFNFNNQNYLYQCILTVNIDNIEECKVVLKRYTLEDQDYIDKLEESIDINKVKEDYIIKKISEFEEKPENPDKSKIKVEKEKEEKPQPEKEGEPQSQEGGEGDFGELNLGGNQEELEEEEGGFEF